MGNLGGNVPAVHSPFLRRINMTQKLICSCLVAMLFAFAAVSTACAEETKAAANDTVVATAPAAGCPCGYVHTAPGCPCGHARACFDPCRPPVNYRVGLFGVIRPVVYAPVYRPVYYPAPVRYRYPACVPCAPYAW
jgi:hypothetical protein